MGLFNFKKKSKDVAPKTVSTKQVLSTAKVGNPSHTQNLSAAVLIRPMITEKSLNLEAARSYVFKVKDSATKPAIKMAVEGLFGVNVEKVNVLNHKGRNKFLKGKWGTQTGFKKAIIRIKAGQKIEAIKS